MSEIDRDAELESEADVGSKPDDEVRRWLKEIDLATEEEKDWREDVKTAIEVYCGEKDKPGTKFNIYHANVATIVPALYNSTPEPDVRRRHGDRDPVAKQSADVLERILAHEIDAYDFDGVIQATVQDMAIASRGVARVSYHATTAPTGMKDEAGELVEDVTYQSVRCQYVPWATFRRGPGRVWEDLPWVAFAAYYTKDGLKELIGKNSKVKLDKIALDMRLGDEKEGAEGDEPNKDIFKRALVWEIWDKDKKRILFVAPGYKDGPIRIEDDPLELEQFFPIPKPMTGSYKPGSLVPICEHRIVKKLLDELDKITGRITALVAQLRVRGMIAGGQGSIDLQRWAEADDGDLVEAANLGAIMDKGSIENLIAWFPLDPTVKAVQALYEQREMVKQSIYEATGIADILRGQSDPNETLGAQQIKQQWGSLRIQKRQQEVQRFIRDLLRLKAELVANKFTKENLILASGLDQDPVLGGQGTGQGAVPTPDPRSQSPGMPPPQPTPPTATAGGMEGGGASAPPAPPPDPREQQMMQQQAQMAAMMAQQQAEAARQKLIEDIVALLRNDTLRSYRIDIETDSTIRGDLTRNQTAMAQFVQGTAQYFQAIAPAVESGAVGMEAAVTIYSSFARNFKLGKQVDDILDKMADEAAAQANQPKPPSPEEMKLQMEMEKMKAEMGMQQQKMQTEIQAMQAKMGMEQQANEAELQFKTQEHSMDLQAKQEDRVFERQAMAEDRVFDIQSQRVDLQSKAQAARQDLDFKRATGQQQLQLAKQKAAQKPKPDSRN